MSAQPVTAPVCRRDGVGCVLTASWFAHCARYHTASPVILLTDVEADEVVRSAEHTTAPPRHTTHRTLTTHATHAATTHAATHHHMSKRPYVHTPTNRAAPRAMTNGEGTRVRANQWMWTSTRMAKTPAFANATLRGITLSSTTPLLLCQACRGGHPQRVRATAHRNEAHYHQ